MPSGGRGTRIPAPTWLKALNLHHGCLCLGCSGWAFHTEHTVNTKDQALFHPVLESMSKIVQMKEKHGPCICFPSDSIEK